MWDDSVPYLKMILIHISYVKQILITTVLLPSFDFFFFFLLGFDEVDSIFASPDDFKELKKRDNARGLYLLEYFVTRCHEIGVM